MTYSNSNPGVRAGQQRRSADTERELGRLSAAIAGRKPFRYRAGEDPLYTAYADRAVQNGRLAMRDTMGRTAALTGGYANSYSQAAGQQAYDEYLRRLGEAMPEFYSLAYRRWQDEGEALRDDYDRLYRRAGDERAQEERAERLAYERRRDELADRRYEAERQAAAERLAYERQRDELADRRYEAEQRSAAERQAEQRQSAADKAAEAGRQSRYKDLVQLISSAGYRPTDAELRAAGLSREAAEALLQAYLGSRKGARRGGSSGGSRKKRTELPAASVASAVAGGRGAGGSLNAALAGNRDQRLL